MKNLLFLIALASSLAACKTPKETVPEPAPPVETEQINPDANLDDKPKRPYQVVGTIGDVAQRSDAYTITNAKIFGNKLFLDITYSGGCAWHKFECVGSMAVMKSMPPQRSIRLIHDNDNDTCEAIVNQTIEIDISAFAESPTPGSEIVLILDGYKEKLNYIYE